MFYEVIQNDNVTAVGGLTLGADPLVAGLMLHSAEHGKPLEGFLVRRTTKDHGLRGQVEGNLAGHKRVVILDDVITSGESALIAAEAAESYKAAGGAGARRGRSRAGRRADLPAARSAVHAAVLDRGAAAGGEVGFLVRTPGRFSTRRGAEGRRAAAFHATAHTRALSRLPSSRVPTTLSGLPSRPHRLEA